MASTEQILSAARELGKLIATHDAARKFESVVGRLQNDVEAQRVLNDYNRHLQAVAQKESEGKPIEVEDKKKLEQLQGQVVRNAVLRDFQIAQMDYLDLMRRVDEAMSGEEPHAANVPGAGALGGGGPMGVA